ncbi:hypothetical protein ACHAXR_003961 [Thalassiosira sp. AJA248-18]
MADSSSSSSPPNLLTLILDVTTYTWTHRQLNRIARDKALAAKNKPSTGPAILDDVITTVLALGAAFSCLNRDNVLVVIAATEEEVSVIYPRKGGEGNMEEVVMGGAGGDVGGGECGERVDTGLLNDYVRLGVAELVNRAAERAEKRAAAAAAKEQQSSSSSTTTNEQQQQSTSASTNSNCKNGAAIASALSLALCTINRFMVASHAGVSALANTSLLQRKDDEGILALMGGGGGDDGDKSNSQSSQNSAHSKGMLLSPRALIIQASPDRTSDYNALMNCAFAANKSEVVIDGCFIPAGVKGDTAKDSPFLQQMVDQTRGVYLSVPSGAAQVGGALSEVLMSVFLPPPIIRGAMNLPKLNNVDFRARCFETGESIDVAQICNQCLSIFKERPKEVCLTCGARVRTTKKKAGGGGGGAKKMKLR